MAATLVGKQGAWEGERDHEGHRTYKITWLIHANALDGPNVIMNCPGLPYPGSQWNFDNDSDEWAFCYPTLTIKPHQPRGMEKHEWWTAQQTFSTKPLNRCNTTTIQDPLMEPQKVSGSFVKYTQEAVLDMNGFPITYSSLEPMRGPQVEFDANRPSVKIEQNVPSLGLATFAQMVDTVNDSTLWGLATRCVKLSNVTWTRNLWGTCNFYYTRCFDFDVDYATFDRYVLDYSDYMISGHWADALIAADSGKHGYVPDTTWIDGNPINRNNPHHFVRAKDARGEQKRMRLDGLGAPITESSGTGTSGTAATILVQKYPVSNFLLLGIPTNLEASS